jgi:hypothetical protein
VGDYIKRQDRCLAVLRSVALLTLSFLRQSNSCVILHEVAESRRNAASNVKVPINQPLIAGGITRDRQLIRNGAWLSIAFFWKWVLDFARMTERAFCWEVRGGKIAGITRVDDWFMSVLTLDVRISPSFCDFKILRLRAE